MKRTIFRPASWPISLKIPLVVALLMIVIGSLVTERVLSKLSDIQDQNLKELSGTYLDGLSSLVLPHVLRDDIWEVFDALERSKAQYENINIVSTIVADPKDNIIAASDPASFQTGTNIPQDHLETAIPENSLKIRSDQPKVRVFRNIKFQDRIVGKLMVTLDVSRQLAERDKITLALIGSNTAFTFLLAVIGYLLTRRMTRPMQVLAEHLEQSKDGSFEEITPSDIGNSSTEALALFASYNSMVKGMNERDMLLVSLHEEEKLAGLGRLAAAMAHEINNPLGGMLTTLETLKRHGDNPEVQIKTIGLLERGLKSIGDVVQTSLLAYRRRSVKRRLSEKDFADLRHLLRPEIRRRAQMLDWEVDWNGEVPLDGTSVRQIGLNLLLNASAAAGSGGKVVFRSSVIDNSFQISVENDGKEIPDDLLYCLNHKGSEQTLQNGIPHACLSFCLNSQGTGQAGQKDSAGIGLWVICRLVEEMHGQTRATATDAGSMISVTIPIGLRAVDYAA